jgi:hypothetical protein
LTEFFLCPASVGTLNVTGDLSHNNGYFQLRRDVVCYGQCSSGDPATSAAASLHDTPEHVVIDDSSVQLPFDPVQVVERAVAALLTLRYKDTVTYRYGCLDEHFNNLGATHFLIWKTIGERSRTAFEH